MIRAEEIYKTVISDWKAGKSSIPWENPDPVWTKWVKDYFYKKGLELGYKAERSESEKCGQGEYLVDLCWWKEERDQWWMEMALESEWNQGKDELEHDFCKLVDIKAYLKVWVCSYGERTFKDRKHRMSQIVAKARFKFPEEQYLVINLPWSQKEEHKNRLIIHAFWIDILGKEHPLTIQPDIINR